MRAGIAAHLGSGSMQSVLETLHRMRFVVPLFVSAKGSDRREIASFTAYEPWSTHGSPGDAEGWTELYYHPFQLWLVDVAARVFFMPWSFSPALREGLAERRADLGKHAELALREIAAAREPSVRQRQARFYAALPALLLADAAVGPGLRGVLHGVSSDFIDQRKAIGRPPTAKQLERNDLAWHRWSRSALRVRAPEVVARDRARIYEFAREAWFIGNVSDPLRQWGDLMPFIRWDECEKLEGSAFAAHRMKELATLLGELVRRVDSLESAQQVYDPGGVEWTRMRLGGEVDGSSFAQRALVASRYGLNPTPTVSWFVEGKSERRVIAAISAARGRLLERHGVVVTDLEGGDNLKHASLAIDVANQLGTLVFVLADSDGKRVAKWARRLIDDGRLDEKSVFWSEPNLAKANFTKAERREAKVGCESRKKPDVAAWLAERYLVPELSRAASPSSRPIVDYMQRVLDAARKHDHFRPRYSHERRDRPST